MYIPNFHKISPWFLIHTGNRKKDTLILEKLTVPRPFKSSPTIYGKRRCISAFTRARHLCLSSARSIQSRPPFFFMKTHFNVILPSTPKYLDFTHQNPICPSPCPHTRFMLPTSQYLFLNYSNTICRVAGKRHSCALTPVKRTCATQHDDVATCGDAPI